MMGCESDMHYREMCSMPGVLEVVFDIKSMINPTHGFFATHLHSEDWPRIVLRDFGIGCNLSSYVGYIDSKWFNDPKREEQKPGNIMWQLPSGILFTKEFLEALPQYKLCPEFYHYEELNSIGRLEWYITARKVDEETGLHELFVNCTMQGHKFAWQLRGVEDGSCEKGCHTMGLWRD